MNSFHAEQRFIVTGASSGIGAQVALTLNSLGATVIAVARNKERLLNVKEQSQNPDNYFIEVKDLTENLETLPSYIKDLKVHYGKISGLVHCAGISPLIPIKAVELNNIYDVFTINYIVPLRLIQGMIDKRNNIGKGTSIVAIASIASYVCDKSQTLYVGSKAALKSSLKVIAKEVASQGIRINTISPSLIQTPLMNGIVEDYYNEMKEKYLFGFGEPSDVAEMVVFLLSDKAKWITGQDYILDCGTY